MCDPEYLSNVSIYCSTIGLLYRSLFVFVGHFSNVVCVRVYSGVILNTYVSFHIGIYATLVSYICLFSWLWVPFQMWCACYNQVWSWIHTSLFIQVCIRLFYGSHLYVSFRIWGSFFKCGVFAGMLRCDIQWTGLLLCIHIIVWTGLLSCIHVIVYIHVYIIAYIHYICYFI